MAEKLSFRLLRLAFRAGDLLGDFRGDLRGDLYGDLLPDVRFGEK